MTALEMINKVQRELRLPQSVTLDTHARLILDYLNDVQRNIMLENYVWDELKVYGEFVTQQSESQYKVAVLNAEIEQIRSMHIDGQARELEHCNDMRFRELKRIYNTTEGVPYWYRIYKRESDGLVVELLPVPDATYTVKVEALKRPPVMTKVDDTPVLDADAIVAGAKMLAKKNLGLDYSEELAEFQAKLTLLGENQGESNFGDVEAV